jgi:hypothetical protein
MNTTCTRVPIFFIRRENEVVQKGKNILLFIVVLISFWYENVLIY